MMRDGKPYSVTVRRELYTAILKSDGMKALESGLIAPLDATEAEMGHKMLAIKEERFAERVFSPHYPSDEKLYYPGFEIFVLRDPPQIVVGGSATSEVEALASAGNTIAQIMHFGCRSRGSRSRNYGARVQDQARPLLRASLSASMAAPRAPAVSPLGMT
jgi:hypothetical protein